MLSFALRFDETVTLCFDLHQITAHAMLPREILRYKCKWLTDCDAKVFCGLR